MHRRLAGLFAALVGFGAAEAQPTAPSLVDPTLDVYGAPQRLVKLPDGRRINLYCVGRGAPTVILTAGLGGWSISWAKVHSAIGERARTCAWDRAGFGHSDPSSLPQTAANTTADLEAALAAARLKGPYVLVGHSAGAFETLLFADRHRADVAGMVLVDPSVPGQATRFAEAAPSVAKANVANQAQGITRQRACADDLAAGKLKPDQPGWANCFRYLPTVSPKVVEAFKRLDTDPARMRTKASLLEQFAGSAEAVVSPARKYGDLPLIVLTQASSPSPPGTTPEDAAALKAGWIAWHDDYAKLSTRGLNLIVQGAGHGIQTDKPQAVIGAVDAVLAQVRQR